MEKSTKIAIEILDSDIWRDHKGVSQLCLEEDRLIFESISMCNRYNSDDYDLPPTKSPHYIRQMYKKTAATGVCICGSYYKQIDEFYYDVSISVAGSADDVSFKFKDKEEAMEVYRKIHNWIFKNDKV